MPQQEVDKDEVLNEVRKLLNTSRIKKALSKEIDAVEGMSTRVKSRHGEGMSTNNAESDENLSIETTFDIASISESDYDENMPAN